MPPKRVDPRVAKEKRQKKIAVGGTVLLVLILVVQVPRTMRMLSPPEEAEAAPAETTPAAPTPAPSGADVVVAPPTLDGSAAPPPAPSSSPVAEPSGQLISFSRFSTKDPFVPQVEEGGSQAGGAKSGAATQSGGAKPGSGPKPGGSGAVPQATSAQLTVNGTAETVAVGSSFPTADPVFLLSAIEGETAKIAVAQGGSFESGNSVLSLRVGETVTLVNVADGTRYVVELRSIP